jgi:hypothetical protein
MAVKINLDPIWWRGYPILQLNLRDRMPSLEMLKRYFIDVNQHISCIEREILMESFVPVEPKNVTSNRSKNLEFMLVPKRDTKRMIWSNNSSNPVHHRREMEGR